MLPQSESAVELTVGFAVADDYDGIYFTLQALQSYHAEALSVCELIVVDNKPGRSSKAIRKLVEEDLAPACHSVRYIAMGDVQGTSPARQRIIDEATAPAFLVGDSHILLPQVGSLMQVIEYWRDHPNSLDLITGPVLWDNRQSVYTHYEDIWNYRMWGVWGEAWVAPDGRHVSVIQDQSGNITFVELAMGSRPIPDLPADVPYQGRWEALERLGFRQLGVDPGDEFEIPAQGLGLFSGLKASWPGFHRQSRGFGGEEHYIHEKVRRAGGRNLCMGWLPWVHRFERPRGVTYNNSIIDTATNYILELRELGIDLDRARRCLVDGGQINAVSWDRIVANPAYRLQQQRPERRAPKEDPIGPGTELKRILRSLGFEATEECPCNKRAAAMNAMGADGCEAEIDKVVGWLREGQDRWGLRDKIIAASRAATNGLALELGVTNWTDPFPALVRLAIKRARIQEEQRQLSHS